MRRQAPVAEQTVVLEGGHKVIFADNGHQRQVTFTDPNGKVLTTTPAAVFAENAAARGALTQAKVARDNARTELAYAENRQKELGSLTPRKMLAASGGYEESWIPGATEMLNKNRKDAAAAVVNAGKVVRSAQSTLRDARTRAAAAEERTRLFQEALRAATRDAPHDG
jgi:hypothetical protein